MIQTATSSVPSVPAAGTPLRGLAIAVVAAAFFCIDHRLFTSQMQDYGTTQEELEQVAASAHLSNQVGFSLLAFLGAFLIARKAGRPVGCDGLLPALMLFFGTWCLASTFWIADAGRTIRCFVVLVFFFLGVLGIARQLAPRDLCVLALGVATIYAAVGACVEVWLGTFTPFSPEYRFAGTLHPNGQGVNCAVLFLAAVALLNVAKRGKPLLITLLVLGAILLVLTRSRTSCGALLLALLALQWLRPGARGVFMALGVTWSMGVLVLLAFLFGIDVQRQAADALLLGRGEHADSLNGRTEVWAEVVPYIRARPLVGYGFRSFWNVDHIDALSSTLDWGVNSAHSLYLEVCLSFGLVGAAALLLVLAGGIRRAAKEYRRTGGAGHGLIFALLVYGVVHGALESDLIEPSFLSFVAACGLSRLAFFRNDRTGHAKPEIAAGLEDRTAGRRAAVALTPGQTPWNELL